MSYSLSDDAGGLFAIDATTGVVTVAGALDRETAASYNIEVTATSSDLSTSVQSYTININDIDEFDVSAVSDSDVSANSVSESAANGTAVGVTASASDADATTNTITYSVVDINGDPVVGGPFAVDGNSGVVTVADNTQLDYESATSHTVYVKATSADGSTSQESFTVNLTDANEAGVGAISDTDAAANAVIENVAPGTVVGVTAFADDPDGTDTVSYSLSDDAGGLFAIDATTGVVTVAGALDRETAASYNIEVTATSSDLSTSVQSYTININDIDEFDVSAVSDSDVSANSVSESAANGTAVGVTASASDADATTNTITYSVVDINGDPVVGGPFAVDANSGVVTVADNTQFDYETATSQTVYIKATSADGSTSQQSFVVNLTDADEFDVTTPTDANAGANTVAEDAVNGTAVGVTASASDGDATTNTITYSVVDINGDPVVGGPFAVDSSSGVVTVADTTQIDYESDPSPTVYIKATSTDGSTAQESFTVNVTNVFDVAPTDPVSFVSAAGILLGAGILAALVPAIRASRRDPAVALRGE